MTVGQHGDRDAAPALGDEAEAFAPDSAITRSTASDPDS
jgi:hypothetical protein